MINASSLDALKKAQWTAHFNRPLYDSYSFSLIPATIEKLLGVGNTPVLPREAVGGEYLEHDCVILLLADGFGWEFFESFAPQYPALQKFIKEGTASKISSQFPSTTAAHVTTINTGLELGQTGIYEWFQYDSLLDEMISPLVFSHAGDKVVGTLKKRGVDPSKIFPFQTLYQKLAQKGVKSVVMQHADIADSPYSQTMLAGAENLPYEHFSDALKNLKRICETPQKEKTYIFLYFGDIDSMGHRHGITSPQFSDAVEHCWSLLQKEFFEKVSPVQKTAFLVTADHGMSPVDPKSTLYLNRLFPEIKETFKTSASGIPLVPAGSCRDFFLHIKEERLAEVRDMLEEKLRGVADVAFVSDLIEQRFFGKLPPSQRLLDRIGNLVVLPYLGESVWWFEKRRFEQHFFAAHGGLTPSEIESIFLFSSLDLLTAR